ncbi:hypothetical protein Lepto7375DRAFT_0922 [Leptolyngbya sp. PCC 7375]|nr:hypothetical protein Lepto7375DRAFT_0922 [Leptolyngbya sp. PCC 7375]
MSESPKYDMRGAQFAGGFAETVESGQIGSTTNNTANLTLYRYECTNDSYTEELGNGVTLTLMLIPAGQFIMGDPESEQVQRQVNISPFLIGRYPVTQDQWRVVAGYGREDIELSPEPSHFKGDNLPVEQVNWYEATEFCKRLSKRTGKHYRLPSEAQWEYACRAETDTEYHFGPQLTSELANYGSTENETTAVGRYPANRWGLHDMHGNVLEWCQDQWHKNYERAPIDGSAWEAQESDASRILRGGSWVSYPRNCRSALRNDFNPDDRFNYVGFRVVCSAPRTS